jgi:hypothetical protein
MANETHTRQRLNLFGGLREVRVPRADRMRLGIRLPHNGPET